MSSKLFEFINVEISNSAQLNNSTQNLNVLFKIGALQMNASQPDFKKLHQSNCKKFYQF